MLKKQFLVLVFIFWLQNSSGFIATLTAILSGAGMIVEFIKTLPSAVESIKEVVTSISSAWGGTSDASDATTKLPQIDGSTVNPSSKKDYELSQQMANLTHLLTDKFKEVDDRFHNLNLFVTDRFQRIETLLEDLPHQVSLQSRRAMIGEFVMTIDKRWADMVDILKEGIDGPEYYNSLMWGNLKYIENELDNFRYNIIERPDITSEASGLFMDIAKLEKDEERVLCNGDLSHNSIINLFEIIFATEIKVFVLQAFAFNEVFPGDKGWKLILDQMQVEFIEYLEEYKADLRSALQFERKPYVRACDPGDSQYHEAVSIKFVERPVYMAYKNWLVHDPDHSLDYCDQEYLDACKITSNNDRNAVCESSPDSECWCVEYNKFIVALMQSRVDENYVVVAVRFQMQQNYIYIEIAEGKLETNGYISEFEWIPPTKKKNGEDPFEALLSTREGRSIALGDVQLPPWYILTGIKFVRPVASEGKIVEFGVYGVKFDYDTGILDPTNETFVLVSDLQGQNLQSSSQTNYVNLFDDTLGKFRNPPYDHSDLSQRLPKFDPAGVLPNPLLALGGAGIFSELDEKNIIHLSLRLFSIDYSIFIDSMSKLNFTAIMETEHLHQT